METNGDNPLCAIIAGPNGAGKTTFALHYLPRVLNCTHFVNADLIAAGLSPLAPEGERISASRLFLKEIERRVDNRQTFALETTLSGRSYLRLIRKLQADGWQVALFYLWLPNVETAIARVRERVEHGGHNIPEADIRRRYPRSLKNLADTFKNVCDLTLCLNNGRKPELMYVQEGKSVALTNEATRKQFAEEALQALHEAVRLEMIKKQKLGHYAVICKNGGEVQQVKPEYLLAELNASARSAPTRVATE